MPKKIVPSEWAQGFCAAIVIFIGYEGGVNTEIREAWEAGGYKFSQLEKLGIDEYDIEILKANKNGLLGIYSGRPPKKVR